ncbi:MAG: 6-phosphofructokinase [Polyangiaceae bacterium]|nr:6-phosphofructokinase [Polyangiaceae bacterium]MCW5790605.1 6-phosphofructokinase [Polyangiaceae bacterium]
MIRKIAVNTGGGDAPGLNAVIRAVVLSAQQRGWEVWGIRQGYRGLIEEQEGGLIPLDRKAVRGITHLGGTILGSTNRGDPFQYPRAVGGELVPTDMSGKLIDRFKELGFDALVAIGGDGSLRLAAKLLERGLPRVIGVPKTIDNDLAGTDVTFGFQTAVATATDAIDKLHSTAQAHERVMVVEVMGRYAGWIALHAGLAGTADAILIPEIEFDIERVCEKVRIREERGQPFSIIVVAEGARPKGGTMQFRTQKGKFSEHAVLGGIAETVAQQIQELTGKETRSLVLGHLQRGGTPVASDRLLSLRLGAAATHYLAETNHSGMVSVHGLALELTPLEEVAGKVRTVPFDSDLLRTGRALGVCFGDEPEGALRGAPPSVRLT